MYAVDTVVAIIIDMLFYCYSFALNFSASLLYLSKAVFVIFAA